MNLMKLISMRPWSALLAALAVVSLAAADASSPETRPPIAASRARLAPPSGPVVHGSGQSEHAKWDDASNHRPPSGPGGTAWDSHYRSLIQTDASAVSKGLPCHAEAARAILADAVESPQHRLQHPGWVLFSDDRHSAWHGALLAIGWHAKRHASGSHRVLA